jgi:hypothetical protein
MKVLSRFGIFTPLLSMDFSHSTLLEIASYQHSLKHAFRRGELALK